MKNFDVEEARMWTNKTLQNPTYADKRRAIALIKQATFKGCFRAECCIDDFNCAKAVQPWLIQLGYNAWIVYRTFYISWEENKQ